MINRWSRLERCPSALLRCTACCNRTIHDPKARQAARKDSKTAWPTLCI